MDIIGNNSKPKPRISRRDFLKLSKTTGLTMLFAAAGRAYISQGWSDWLDVTQVRLALPRLPGSFSGFRIAQVSDIHMGGWMTIERLRQVFDTVNKIAPDIVAITGDFMHSYDSRVIYDQELLVLEAELKELATKFEILAVLGNRDYWADASAILGMLQRCGVKPLVNKIHEVQRGKDFYHIAGVDDVIAGQSRLDDVVAELPDKGCAILMAHEPDFADVSAATGRFDLQISGHSHGGQVNLPLIGAPVLPQLAHKYPQGLYRVGEMYQYTNRGVGMTEPFIRINCRPEITVFTLESK